jgi:hypothetical protein
MGGLVAAQLKPGLYLREEPADSGCSRGSSLFPRGLLSGTGFIQKLDARGEAHLDPLGFSLVDGPEFDLIFVHYAIWILPQSA